jgi:hypothetical protein
VERLPDQLIGEVRTVEVAGVDMIDAGRHSLAKHPERRVAVLGRPEHTGPGELHRAVAEAIHDAVARGKGAGDAEISHGAISDAGRPTPDQRREHVAAYRDSGCRWRSRATVSEVSPGLTGGVRPFRSLEAQPNPVVL